MDALEGSNALPIDDFGHRIISQVFKLTIFLDIAARTRLQAHGFWLHRRGCVEHRHDPLSCTRTIFSLFCVLPPRRPQMKHQNMKGGSVVYKRRCASLWLLISFMVKSSMAFCAFLAKLDQVVSDPPAPPHQSDDEAISREEGGGMQIYGRARCLL